MNRSTKIALYTTAALLFAAGHAVAGGPPWSGGPGGPGNANFDAWAGGSVMSGSANEFGFSADFRDAGAFGAGVADFAGRGAPEGVIAARPGSTYRNTAGGAGTSFYVKESGLGKTGWVGK